jgi:hypothetical protein
MTRRLSSFPLYIFFVTEFDTTLKVEYGGKSDSFSCSMSEFSRSDLKCMHLGGTRIFQSVRSASTLTWKQCQKIVPKWIYTIQSHLSSKSKSNIAVRRNSKENRKSEHGAREKKTGLEKWNKCMIHKIYIQQSFGKVLLPSRKEETPLSNSSLSNQHETPLLYLLQLLLIENR